MYFRPPSFITAAPLASRSHWLHGPPSRIHAITPLRAPFARRVRPAPARLPVHVAPSMLFDTLSENLSSTIRKLRGVDKITEQNVAGAMKEVKRALLDADVNLRVVNGLLKKIKKNAVGVTVPTGIEPGQMLIKVMYDELTAVMGSEVAPLAWRKRDADAAASADGPTVILLAGLQGAGKTTAAAKLALYCKNEKRSVMMIAADVYRPAAIDQLQTLGKSIEVDVFSLGADVDPREIVKKGIAQAKEKGIDTVIVDTAGRQVVDSKLMNELKDIKKVSAADETLLVVDAMTGQEAATLTRAFNEAVDITGAILTKMDGDTRGGAALSVQQVSGKPIKFIGVGEKVEKLEAFYPDRMASRILGMGDVLTLVEKAQEEMDLAEAEKMTKKMMEAKFDFNDFLKQTKMISNMGNMAGLLKMMPGAAGQVSSAKLEEAEMKLKVADSLIKSMTKKERAEPELLFQSATAKSRIRRIAGGSGRSVAQAQSMISDFEKMRTMMQAMSQKMAGGAQGEGGAAPALNRSQRRKAGKKKAQRDTVKRGFG